MRWCAIALVCLSCTPAAKPTRPVAVEPAADATLPARSSEPPGANWFGTWKGEFGGTQEFIQLELSDTGRFRYQLTSGPDTSCCVNGDWSVGQKTFTLTPRGGSCKGPGLSSYSRIYSQTPDTFSIADPAYLEHIERGDDGKLSGPVWMFERDAGEPPKCE
ncbi:MAG: hypothetical protein R3B07_21440 [Polyangiaceae bacterium]